MDFLSGAYFEVALTGENVDLTGRFTSVSGLNMEVEYEIYNEGGSSYPRFFYKESKPQVLVLEQGVHVDGDGFSRLMEQCVQGQVLPLSGPVTLKDSSGVSQRTWVITGAYLQKYMGPELNSNQAALAVSRVELLYNGCF